MADFVNGDRGSNYPSESDFVADGVPFISAADIADGGIDMSRAKRISREAYERLRSGKTQRGDILFCLRGSLGKAGRIERVSEAAIASSLVIIRAKQATDARYLFYVLQGPGVQRLMGTLDNGSVQPNLSVREIAKIAVPDVSVSEQRAIAKVLGTLDDKIELNRRMSETLELMARSLFKSWFVDFDPVRSKVGACDSRLPERIADLFPDSFTESDYGPIPKGWRATSWGDLVTLEYGRGLREYTHDRGAYPVFGTNGQIGKYSEPLCPYPGIVVGRKGAYRGIHYSEQPFYVIDTAFFVTPKQPIELRWAYYEMRRHDINTLDSGSAIPSTSREDFYRLPVIAPPKAVQNAFVEQLAPCWSQRELLAHQSSVLSELRAALLPKLISGEIRVRNADALNEAALK